MKFGEQLEKESVPKWSMYNLDYNSLKRAIKVHTTRDQATAIAIPGQPDKSLRAFEDGLFLELCKQHDRVDLFVKSKAGEVTRRLDMLARKVDKWIGKCPENPTDSTVSKQQRTVIKYERRLFELGDEISALSRFANAQIIAFRKIIKKYKKWTRSTTLSARFNEYIAGQPSSFTRRNFEPLQSRLDDILTTLRNSTPALSEPSSPSTTSENNASRPSTSAEPHSFEPLPEAAKEEAPRSRPQVTYWNEYDDGSECEGPENDYAIYINPDEDTSFAGLGYVQAILAMPFSKVQQWFKIKREGERQPLLGEPSSRPQTSRPGTATHGYFSAASVDSDEEGYASSGEFPNQGYAAHYSFPSIGDQKIVHYRENVLFWVTVGCFIGSFVLLAISGLLILTGRHRLRVEVDAGVTVGVACSLLSACSGLAATIYRRGPLTVSHRIMIWSTFIAACLLNGMLLVLVVGNTP